METMALNGTGKQYRSYREHRENRMAWLYLAWMLMLFVAKCILKINVPGFILLISTSLYAVSGSKERMLTAVVSSIPFSIGFQYRYLLLVCIAVYLFIRRDPLQKNSTIVILALFAWEAIHLMYGFFSPADWLRDFAEMLFLMIVLSMDLREFSYQRIIRVFAVAMVGISAIMLWMQLERNNYQVLRMFYSGTSFFRFGNYNMEGDRFAVNFNPNELGMMCNVATSGILVLYKRNEHRKMDLALMLMLIFFGCMTLSKTYYVVLTLIFIMVMAVGGRNHFRRNIRISAVLLLVILVIAWQFPEIFATAWRRMTETEAFSHRDVLFAFYFKHIFSSAIYLLFGIGAQNFQDKIFDIYGYRYGVPHNFIQEIWCMWGLLGVIMMGYLLYHLIRRSKRFSGNGRSYHYLPYVALLASCMVGHLITSGRGLLMLIFSYLCLCVPVSEQDSRKRPPEDTDKRTSELPSS